MSWTTPATFVTGATLTAAQLNTNVRDNTKYLFDPPMVKATRATLQAIANATETAVQFIAADEYDTDSMHDPGSNPDQVVINTAGVYDVWASITFAAATTGLRYAVVATGTGVAVASQTDGGPAGATHCNINVKGQVLLTAADALRVFVYQTSGASLNIWGTGTGGDSEGTTSTVPCFLGASWVGSGA